MNEKYKPSTNFVSKVMEQVYAYESTKHSFTEWLIIHPSIRYALVGTGTLLGIFKTVSAF
jgi:hypothetical protein